MNNNNQKLGFDTTNAFMDRAKEGTNPIVHSGLKGYIGDNEHDNTGGLKRVGGGDGDMIVEKVEENTEKAEEHIKVLKQKIKVEEKKVKEEEIKIEKEVAIAKMPDTKPNITRIVENEEQAVIKKAIVEKKKEVIQKLEKQVNETKLVINKTETE